MNYCTLEDIRGHVPEARLVEITDDTNPNATGSVNEAVVDKAIAESSNVIDAYIGKRFKLPLPGIPSVLRTICIDLSIYNLYERVTELNVSDGMQLRYKNAVSLLKDIADGKASIGDVPEEGTIENGFCAVSKSGDAQFTMDSMRSL
jgi:phage gp36-like protein